jgi:hypothetical protein
MPGSRYEGKPLTGMQQRAQQKLLGKLIKRWVLAVERLDRLVLYSLYFARAFDPVHGVAFE